MDLHQDPQSHLDGTLVFQRSEDKRAEADVAVELGQVWNCSVRAFGDLSMIDWYAERNGRVVGLIEIKGSRCKFGDYQTAKVSARKYLALTFGAIAFQTAGIFVIRYLDGPYWFDAFSIRPDPRMGGHRNPRAKNDRELMIDVPLENLKPIRRAKC